MPIQHLAQDNLLRSANCLDQNPRLAYETPHELAWEIHIASHWVDQLLELLAFALSLRCFSLNTLTSATALVNTFA